MGYPLFSPGPRRKVLYQRAPRNIHRHVILSEIKEAVAALPPVRSGAASRSQCELVPPLGALGRSLQPTAPQ